MKNLDVLYAVTFMKVTQLLKCPLCKAPASKFVEVVEVEGGALSLLTNTDWCCKRL